MAHGPLVLILITNSLIYNMSVLSVLGFIKVTIGLIFCQNVLGRGLLKKFCISLLVPCAFRGKSDLYSFSRGNIYAVQEKRCFYFFLPN